MNLMSVRQKSRSNIITEYLNCISFSLKRREEERYLSDRVGLNSASRLQTLHNLTAVVLFCELSERLVHHFIAHLAISSVVQLVVLSRDRLQRRVEIFVFSMLMCDRIWAAKKQEHQLAMLMVLKKVWFIK